MWWNRIRYPKTLFIIFWNQGSPKLWRSCYLEQRTLKTAVFGKTILNSWNKCRLQANAHDNYNRKKKFSMNIKWGTISSNKITNSILLKTTCKTSRCKICKRVAPKISCTRLLTLWEKKLIEMEVETSNFYRLLVPKQPTFSTRPLTGPIRGSQWTSKIISKYRKVLRCLPWRTMSESIKRM